MTRRFYTTHSGSIIPHRSINVEFEAKSGMKNFVEEKLTNSLRRNVFNFDCGKECNLKTEMYNLFLC